jgi:hypothetical protein
VGERLHRIYLVHLGRNTRRLHRLGKLLRLLEQAGIRVAVLKGAHLAEAVYRNIGLRSMNDLDILVRKTDLDRTMQCIGEAGFLSPENRLDLDVHTNLSQSIAGLKISTEELLDPASPVVVSAPRRSGSARRISCCTWSCIFPTPTCTVSPACGACATSGRPSADRTGTWTGSRRPGARPAGVWRTRSG